MIFNQYDAEAILKIPLSRRQVQDKMVWMHCRNGKYTVKSGYHVARMLAGDTNGREESSEQRANHRVWNRLWQLRVPSKIKVFGWSACIDILPSKVNLVRRQILKEDRCGLCQQCPCREGKIPDLSQADTSQYQVHKIQPITKHHVLLLDFAITTQKPTEICQVSCKNQSHLSTCKQ